MREYGGLSIFHSALDGSASGLLEETLLISSFGNEPFGSRPEPGACLIALILRLQPGEVPEGRAEFTSCQRAPARKRIL
jgi:hypothetical protein